MDSLIITPQKWGVIISKKVKKLIVNIRPPIYKGGACLTGRKEPVIIY